MKSYSKYFFMFLIMALFSARAEVASDDLLSQRDIQLITDNPEMEFVYLPGDARQLIAELAQADRENQVVSACTDALRFMEEGFVMIPRELAVDVAAEIEIKQAQEEVARGCCKTRCFTNVGVRNLLSANKLRACDGGVVSGGLVVNSATASGCTTCSTKSTTVCTNVPCITDCALVVNGQTTFNGPTVMNCGGW